MNSFAWLALPIFMAQADSPVWNQFGGPGGNFSVKSLSGPVLPTWKREFGPGRGGIVTDGKSLFLTYAQPDPAAKGKAGDEVVACLDIGTGKTIWEERVAVKMLEKQQYFGGSPMQPQATPCVHDGLVFTLGFTGLLHARDAKTGKLKWQKDLVADFGAEPVQFGFAGSPVVHEGKLILNTGGKLAFVILNPADGQTVAAGLSVKPSYATPLVVTNNGIKQIVLLTGDSVLGMSFESGKALWEYNLPKKGLTNVPTPIPMANGDFLIAGQGCDGVRRIRVEFKDAKWSIREIWHQKKVQYFYTTWVADSENVYGFSGNAGKRFAALRLADGEVIANELGQTDANALFIDGRLLLSRRDGVVSECKVSKDGLEVLKGMQAVNGRCWAPPTVIGQSLIIRSDSEVACVPFSNLKADFKMPPDSGRTAMDDAFGGPRK